MIGLSLLQLRYLDVPVNGPKAEMGQLGPLTQKGFTNDPDTFAHILCVLMKIVCWRTDTGRHLCVLRLRHGASYLTSVKSCFKLELVRHPTLAEQTRYPERLGHEGSGSQALTRGVSVTHMVHHYG